MNEKGINLDDSFDNLDERIDKEIIQEINEMSYEELLAQAKNDGLKDYEDLSIEELKYEIIEHLRQED